MELSSGLFPIMSLVLEHFDQIYKQYQTDMVNMFYTTLFKFTIYNKAISALELNIVQS